MPQKRTFSYIFYVIAITAISFGLYFTSHSPAIKGKLFKDWDIAQEKISQISTEEPLENKEQRPNDIIFVGPRKNIPQNSPKDEGFWSFAIPVQNVLSRSGQPTIEEFRWLKENGWKSDIDLRVDNDHNELSDDSKIPGFNELGLNYLHLQIVDGAAPTDQQAEEFLNFVTDPKNQPAHVHCRAGIGRAGTMVALYRYAVQGWPVEKATEESRLFRGGISSAQKKWLTSWAKKHEPGSYNKQ